MHMLTHLVVKASSINFTHKYIHVSVKDCLYVTRTWPSNNGHLSAGESETSVVVQAMKVDASAIDGRAYLNKLRESIGFRAL